MTEKPYSTGFQAISNHDLAVGGSSRRALAQYGVAVQTITQCKAEHKPEINTIRRQLVAEMTDLWLTEKKARMDILNS